MLLSHHQSSSSVFYSFPIFHLSNIFFNWSPESFHILIYFLIQLSKLFNYYLFTMIYTQFNFSLLLFISFHTFFLNTLILCSLQILPWSLFFFFLSTPALPIIPPLPLRVLSFHPYKSTHFSCTTKHHLFHLLPHTLITVFIPFYYITLKTPSTLLFVPCTCLNSTTELSEMPHPSSLIVFT